MGTWCKVTFPLEQAGIDGEATRLQDAFGSVLIASGAPKDAAMFGQRSRDFKSWVCYFSPGAVRLIGKMLARYSPVECAAPEKGTVSLLTGDANAFEMLPNPKS